MMDPLPRHNAMPVQRLPSVTANAALALPYTK
jgi:hypothetical protein